MAVWRIIREWSYSGSGEAGADVEGGRAFALESEATGEQRQLSVEIAAGGRGVPAGRLREVARAHLNDADPPRRIVVDREGNVGRVIPHE